MTRPDTISPDIEVDLPEGWTHRRDLPPFALVAKADPWPAPIAPNLLVAVTPATPGLAPELYLAQQLDGVATSLNEPVLIDAAVDRGARSVSFLVAHATGGVDLTMVQHHLVTGDGFVVAASATATDHDWPGVAAELLALVRSVRAVA